MKNIIRICVLSFVLLLTGCKKADNKLQSIDIQLPSQTVEETATGTDIEETTNSSVLEEYTTEEQISFPEVTETMRFCVVDGVPEEEQDRIMKEAEEFLTNYCKDLFTYHGESDFENKILPYFGNQGEYLNHDYDFPRLVTKEFIKKGMDSDFKDAFIYSMYIVHYNTEKDVYVVSYGVNITADMQTNMLGRDEYCNDMVGKVMFTGGKWEVAQCSLTDIAKSPCGVTCVNSDTGEYYFSGEIIELWDVLNAELPEEEIPEVTNTDGYEVIEGESIGKYK